MSNANGGIVEVVDQEEVECEWSLYASARSNPQQNPSSCRRAHAQKKKKNHVVLVEHLSWHDLLQQARMVP